MFGFQHASYHIHDCSIISFSNAILLRCVSCCKLMLNSVLLKETCTSKVFLPYVLNALILQTLCFSTNSLNVLKASHASDFCIKKYTQVFLLKSSIKVIKYLHPPDVGISTKHKSE